MSELRDPPLGTASTGEPAAAEPADPEQQRTAAEQVASTIAAARRLVDEGEEAARSAGSTASALTSLAKAEFALARAAIVRSLVLGVAAVIAGFAGLLYLLATLTAVLAAAGLGWPAALGISTGLVLVVAGLLAWRALRLLRMARFEHLRREFARIREIAPWG